ncbi:hypothetical protein [Neisseria sp. S1]
MIQLPSGSCVLKPAELKNRSKLLHQLPSGSCVLKHQSSHDA